MIFIVLTFLAAFLIEGLGTAVSVIGLSTLFGANPIIIALAVALDLGKLVVVSLLYKYWAALGKLMKSYALIAALVTMVITSAGAAGYLTGEFQKAIMGTQETTLKVDVLKKQQAKYEERKKQIDDQIAHLPEKTSVSQRLRLMNGFKQEQAELTAKIAEIDKQLPELQIHQIGVEAKAGPILYISKAFNVSVEEAVKYVVLMIIFVFDPLAVFLIIAGNFLIDQRKKPKVEQLAQQITPENVHPEQDLGPPLNGMSKEAAMQWLDGLRRQDDGVDEAGFGNSAVQFDEQIRAMPPELRQATPVAPELANEEPVEEDDTATPMPPYHHEPTPQPARPQIRLEDLRPMHRSSLHDVRDDATVVFDQNPRKSQHDDFYSSQF